MDCMEQYTGYNRYNDHAPESFTMEYVHMQCIERFIVLMYSKTCGSATVNDAGHHLFSNGSRSLDSSLPTQAALFEHVERSLLHASFIWKQSTTCHQEIPVFDKCGWEQDKHIKQWQVSPFEKPWRAKQRPPQDAQESYLSAKNRPKMAQESY